MAIPNDFLPILPKELSKPALHPLSVNALVFGVPIIICLLPNLSALSKTFRNLKTFENQLIQLSRAAGGLEDVISSMPLSHDGTSTASRDANLISVSIGVSGILGNWQLESFIRSCTGAALIAVLLFVEYIIYKRLSGASIYLEAVEQAALRESPAANHSFIIEKDYPDIIGLNEEKEDNLTHLPLQNSLNRTRSILSSSTRSGGRPSPLYPDEGPRRPQSVLSRSCIGHPNARPTSRSASHRSFSAMSMSSASSRLYVPELPDFSVTLPSPSLVKDDLASSMRGIGGDGPSPYSPALALFGDKLDRSVSGPRDRFTSNEDFSISSSRIQPLVRGTSQRSEASSLACSEKIFEPRQKRHTSLIPDQVTSSVQNGMKREDEVSSDYFALGRLPYDLDDEDQYEAQLEGLKFGAAVAHMLTPYGGIAEPAEKTTMPSEAPSTMVMEGDVTKQSQLSRLHTPGLGHEREVQTSKHRAPSAVSRRVSTHSRPQSRASSYSYGSQSSLGSSSIFSKSSKRTAASWRSKLFHEQRYQGPAALQLKTLKKSRIIETSVLGLFILVSSLLELVCGIAGRNVLESKSVSRRAFWWFNE